MAKWVRKGDCNHCGWCCIFSFDPVLMFIPKDGGRQDEFMKVRGFRPAVHEGKEGWLSHAEAYRPCPQHKNNGCLVYDKRPAICKDFPWMPDQIKNTPCSYWFEDEDGKEMPIGGDASPHGLQYNNFESLKRMEFTERPAEITPVENGQ